MKKKTYYKKINKDFIESFNSEVSKANSIVITSHISPDDDSISSVLSIYYYLVNVLKVDKTKVKMVYSWKKTDRWSYFSNFDKIQFVDDISERLENVDCLIMLDGSGWQRISNNEDIKNFAGRTICIDHHPDPDDIFDLHLVAVDTYTSTVEIIYRLFYENVILDKRICEILLLGILGDTGNFRFVKPSQVGVFDVVKRLVKEGDIYIESVQSAYSNISKDILDMLTQLLNNLRVEKVTGWPRFAVAWLSETYIEENGFDQYMCAEAAELLKEYLKSIKGVSWGLVVTPKPGGSKISGRSIPGSVSVRDIFEKMDIGGGHDRAAGAFIKDKSTQEAVSDIIKWLEKNKPLLR